jgi:hypothetical protein
MTNWNYLLEGGLAVGAGLPCNSWVGLVLSGVFLMFWRALTMVCLHNPEAIAPKGNILWSTFAKAIGQLIEDGVMHVEATRSAAEMCDRSNRPHTRFQTLELRIRLGGFLFTP